MSTTTTFAEVAEGVRAAIAAYTLALDDGRTDDVVDLPRAVRERALRDAVRGIMAPPVQWW